MRLLPSRLPHAILAACLCLGCRAEPTSPHLEAPGFRTTLHVPGIADSTFVGTWLQWSELGPDIEVEWRILEPPAPLESPVVFQLRWSGVAPEGPVDRTYSLVPGADSISLYLVSNYGYWIARAGTIRLGSPSDSLKRFSVSATLAPMFPEDSLLPMVRMEGEVLVVPGQTAPQPPDLRMKLTGLGQQFP